MKKMNLLAGIVLLAFVFGCETCDTCFESCYDDQPPAVPTGVGSITGDDYVVIYWNPVYEEDLAGYGIYRSRYDEGPYHRIGTVNRGEETVFYDEDVVNGMTYFYAVDAFDYSGNESALSYETVDDTPRPEGWDLYWFTNEYDASQAGIALLPDQGVVVVSDGDVLADYYLTVDGEGLKRIVPLGANQIQDYGYTEHPDEVDEAPLSGWSQAASGVEVISGHTYILRTGDGYYGKVRVETVGPDWIIVYWALQIKRWSTELAPPVRRS